MPSRTYVAVEARGCPPNNDRSMLLLMMMLLPSLACRCYDHAHARRARKRPTYYCCCLYTVYTPARPTTLPFDRCDCLSVLYAPAQPQTYVHGWLSFAVYAVFRCVPQINMSCATACRATMYVCVCCCFMIRRGCGAFPAASRLNPLLSKLSGTAALPARSLG